MGKKRKICKTLKIAHVVWEDIEANEGWHKHSEIKEYLNQNQLKMKSVGWLVYQGDDCVVLAQSASTHHMGELLKIPTVNVKSIHILGKP